MVIPFGMILRIYWSAAGDIPPAPPLPPAPPAMKIDYSPQISPCHVLRALCTILGPAAILAPLMAGLCTAAELVPAAPAPNKPGFSEADRCAINDLWEQLQEKSTFQGPLERLFHGAFAERPLPPERLRAELEMAQALLETWEGWNRNPFRSNPPHDSGKAGIPGGF